MSHKKVVGWDYINRDQAVELPKKEEIERFLEAELKEQEELVSGKRTRRRSKG